MNNLEKWIWIELIGFDNEKPDFGVKEYLEGCGFRPEGITLLLTWLGFVLDHKGLEEERPLDPCECSYYAHGANAQRHCQSWTNHQLRALIRVLQSYGIKVFLSFFNFAAYRNEWGERIACAYLEDKAFLCETDRFGRRSSTVNMLKRLENGEWFEDVLQERTVKVLKDYGFDGLHIADGISSGRLSLQEGDYSDNMVEQFLTEYPTDEIETAAEGNEEKMLARAACIWQHHRRAWIDFHCRRWLTFFEKFDRRLTEAGKEAVFNNAWTRDPFEAIYRYGVDYRAIAKLGLRGCMPEDVSAGLAILAQEDNGYLMNSRQREQVHYDFLANLMLIRGAMPKLRLTPLAGVHDMMEQWGVLEHMPTSMTRNVMCNLNTLFWNGEEFVPIEDGPWFCLGDSITREQWRFILGNWEIGDPGKGAAPVGPAWVWSDRLLDRELDGFIRERQPSGVFWLSRLLAGGAPIHAVVRIEDLISYTGDLIVPNPALLPQEERVLLSQYDRGTVYFVGKTQQGDPTFGIIGAEVLCTGKISESYDFDPVTGMESAAGWPHPLAYPTIGDEFFRTAAQLLIQRCGCPAIIKYAERCELITLRMPDNSWRVYIGNDDYYYNIPVVDMGKMILSVRRLTGYEGYHVPVNGNTFRCRIPGRGMEAFSVITE